MIGAFIGDVYGSIYEFDNEKDKSKIKLSRFSTPTDDSIMTIATVSDLYCEIGH